MLKWTEESFRSGGPSPELRQRSALGDGGWVPVRLMNLDSPTRDHDSGPGEVGASGPHEHTGGSVEFFMTHLTANGEPTGKIENLRLFLGDATELRAGWFTIAARNRAWSQGVARLVWGKPLQRINGGKRLLIDLAHHNGSEEDLSVEAMVAAGLMVPYDPFLLNSPFFPGGHPFMRTAPVDAEIVQQLKRSSALQARVNNLEFALLSAIANRFGLFEHEGWVPPGIWRNNRKGEQKAWNELISVDKAKRLLSA